MRKYIGRLEQMGLIKKIAHLVDWRYEIGELSRKYRTSPLLFKNIKDYPGCAVFTGGLCKTGFVAMNAGMEFKTKIKELIRELKARFNNPLPPVSVPFPNGYKFTDFKKVNIYDLPVPWWNPLDGGRYVGTWHLNVTHDPLTGKRNTGVYRMQVVSRNQTTVSVSSGSHLARHAASAEKMGKDLEMAVAIGVDETSVIAAAASLPYGVDEYEFAGAIQQKSLKICPCRIVNIDVPCGTEYILEGVIKKGVRIKDGPYLDYTGKLSVNPFAFLFEIKSISKRDNPVFRGMSVGEAGAEDHLLFSILSHLRLVDFHGSSIRQVVQNILLRRNMFTLFQYCGRVGAFAGKIR